MKLEEYKVVVKETIINEYPTYFQTQIIKNLEKDNAIYNDKRKKNDKNLPDVSTLDKERDKLNYLFNNFHGILKSCEDFEYKRAYRYCSIFKLSEFQIEIIKELCENGKVVEYMEVNRYNDNIDFTAKKPTFRIIDNTVFLKFSFELKNRDDNKTKIKYPIVAIIYQELGVLEIRLDTVAFKYKSSENFYIEKIGLVKAWIISYLKCSLENIDFEAVNKYMKAEKDNEVTIVSLKMKRDGMTAVLDSASNEELTIPILGELKKLIKSEQAFYKNKDTEEIKTILENFITEIEETSYLPSVKILWHKKKIKLLAMHGYKEEQYSLFKYSDELRDKECMCYVTRYLMQCERELRESLNIE